MIELFLKYLVAYGLCFKAIEKVSKYFENIIKQDVKISISKWLNNNELTVDEKWPNTFIEIFDRVFTKKHLSFKCFFRSTLASYVSAIIIFIIYIIINPKFFSDLIDGADSIENIAEFARSGIVAILFFNMFPDYISLLETRFILKKIKQSVTTAKIIALLFMDLLFTTLSIFVPWFIFTVILTEIAKAFAGMFNTDVSSTSTSVITYLKDTFDLFISSCMFTGEVGVLGVVIYTTYLTSVWIWLYVMSGILIKKIITPALISVDLIKNKIDIDNKPLESIGFISNVIVSVIFIAVFIAHALSTTLFA